MSQKTELPRAEGGATGVPRSAGCSQEQPARQQPLPSTGRRRLRRCLLGDLADLVCESEPTAGEHRELPMAGFILGSLRLCLCLSCVVEEDRDGDAKCLLVFHLGFLSVDHEGPTAA